MDGIFDISYDEAEAKISFKTDSFQAFALMQETHINFPFQSWELRPLELNSALLTINGALFDISITIKVADCKKMSHLLIKTENTRKCHLPFLIAFFSHDVMNRVISVCCSQSK